MNEFKQCPKCGEWHYLQEPCPELYIISDPDYLATDKGLHAWSFDDAAGRYVKFRELIPTQGKVKFNVKKMPDGDTRIYQATAKVEVSFEVKEENAIAFTYAG